MISNGDLFFVVAKTQSEYFADTVICWFYASYQRS